MSTCCCFCFVCVYVCLCVPHAALDVPEIIGRECVAMTRLQRQAADAFGVLETAQANMVSNTTHLCHTHPTGFGAPHRPSASPDKALHTHTLLLSACLEKAVPSVCVATAVLCLCAPLPCADHVKAQALSRVCLHCFEAAGAGLHGAAGRLCCDQEERHAARPVEQGAAIGSIALRGSGPPWWNHHRVLLCVCVIWWMICV